MTIRDSETFQIDYFLNSIEVDCLSEFVNEFFTKRSEVSYFESNHPLALFAAYDPEFVLGLDFQPKTQVCDDFWSSNEAIKPTKVCLLQRKKFYFYIFEKIFYFYK